MKSWIAGFIVWMLAGSAWGQAIHLKHGIDRRPALSYRQVEGLPFGTHVILQFRSFPDREIRNELARRHAVVIGYVPDNALMIATSRSLRLAGLDVVWAGRLYAQDKVSPLLSTITVAAYVVVFHPDVSLDRAKGLVEANAFDILPNPSMLPSQLLVAGDAGGIAALAELDEVAYILPASPDLLAGNFVMGCAGPITEVGAIGEYAAVGRGWAKDSSGTVALNYFLQSLTDKVEASAAQGEIERAFREWQKYANISLLPGTRAAAARTIAVLFARGAHGDAYPFDGSGGILAHTFYPSPPNSEPIAGDMHFDADESWHVGSNIDLFTVALHEAGHALGLGHSDRPEAVMYPYYRFATGLSDDDIAGLRDLYGTSTAQPPVESPVPIPVTPPVQPPAQPVVPSGSSDTTPPTLRVISPAATIFSTSSGTTQISGTAGDNVGVVSVKWATSNGDAGNASGTTMWSADVPLLVGSTVITIRAYDAAGNSAWRSITAVRH